MYIFNDLYRGDLDTIFTLQKFIISSIPGFVERLQFEILTSVDEFLDLLSIVTYLLLFLSTIKYTVPFIYSIQGHLDVSEKTEHEKM